MNYKITLKRNTLHSETPTAFPLVVFWKFFLRTTVLNYETIPRLVLTQNLRYLFSLILLFYFRTEWRQPFLFSVLGNTDVMYVAFQTVRCNGRLSWWQQLAKTWRQLVNFYRDINFATQTGYLISKSFLSFVMKLTRRKFLIAVLKQYDLSLPLQLITVKLDSQTILYNRMEYCHPWEKDTLSFKQCAICITEPNTYRLDKKWKIFWTRCP